jgi:hypothetical protein
MSLLSSGSKNKLSKKPAGLLVMFHAGFLLGLFFGSEKGDDVSNEISVDFNGLHGPISQKI